MSTPVPTSLLCWQRHQDPPNLWPTLVGLSILAHISLLGVALPLTLRLMSNGTHQAESVTIPIELIAPDSTLAPEAIVSEAPSSQPPPTVDAESSAATARHSTSASPTTSAQPPNSKANSPAAVSPLPSRSEQIPTSSPDQSTSPLGTTANPNRSTSSPPSTSSNRAGTRNPAAPTSPASPPTSAGSQSNPQNTLPSSATPQPLPTLGGGEALTPPQQTADSAQSSVMVSFVSVDPIAPNILGDRPDEYPRLQATQGSSIVLNTRHHNCDDKINTVPLGRVSSRVRISATGNIVEAWPWPNRPGSELEQFVACLLPQSDFHFTPARSETERVQTDMVILEIEIGPG